MKNIEEQHKTKMKSSPIPLIALAVVGLIVFSSSMYNKWKKEANSVSVKQEMIPGSKNANGTVTAPSMRIKLDENTTSNEYTKKTLFVTSKCDPLTEKTLHGKKIKYYSLVNTKVEVATAHLDGKKLVSFTGVIRDNHSEANGDFVYCDTNKHPVVFKMAEGDSDVAILDSANNRVIMQGASLNGANEVLQKVEELQKSPSPKSVGEFAATFSSGVLNFFEQNSVRK